MSKKYVALLMVVVVVSFVIVACVGCTPNYPPLSVDLSEYDLVFYDEFEGTDLDPTKWKRTEEQLRQASAGGTGWWRDECTQVADGNLVLTSMFKDGELKSGAVDTKGLFENTYGYYEIKFKVDKTQGLWYAFWLQCDGVTSVGNAGKDGTEIDVFEIIPVHKEFQTNFHWDGYGEDHQVGSGTPLKINDAFYEEWHIVKFLWTEQSYTVELDGEVTFHTEGDDNAKYGGICAVDTHLKFSSEFGSWGGKVIEDMLPATMLVDYVKVYQHK